MSAALDDSPYNQLVARVMKGDMTVDFRALRMECLKVSNCNARGSGSEMLEMQEALRAEEYERAAKLSEGLIDKGFANISAHAACARAYEGLHNAEKAKFHHDVTAALIALFSSQVMAKHRRPHMR
jgi:hypothetical protein